MNDDLEPGIDCQSLGHYYEQCRLTAYPDPASPRARAQRAGRDDPSLSGAPWSIGFGDTGPDVVEGLTITQDEAEERYMRRLTQEFAPAVRSAVHARLNQKQFDAVVDIFYNVGAGNMSASTLVRLLNEGDFSGAAGQFPRWNLAGGQVMKGLQRRREAERLVFIGYDAGPAISAALAKFP